MRNLRGAAAVGVVALGLALAAAAPAWADAAAAGASADAPAAAAPGAGMAQMAGSVVVPAGTTLQGSVNLMAGQVEVDGTLTGSVSLSVGQVDVGPQGVVQGGVSVGIGQLTLRPGGRVEGQVQAGGRSAQGLSCPADAPADCTLAGAGGGWTGDWPGGSFALRGPWTAMAARFFHWPRWLGPSLHVLSWLGRLALALPVAALFPSAVSTVTRRMEADPWRSLLAGLCALVLALPALILVSITIIGIPVAFAAALALVAAWFFGYVGVATLVGRRTLGLGGVAAPNPLLGLLLGSALILLAGWVPVLGGLAGLAVACLGVGAVLLTRFGTGSMWPRGGGTGAGTGATAARAADPASGSDPAPRP